MLVALRLLAAVSVAAVALVATALTAPAQHGGISTGTGSFSVRCSFWRTTAVEVDWYAPQGAPKALVYLQHGWLGSKKQMRDAALAFADGGYLVAVPSLSSASVSCGLNNESFIRALGSALADGTLGASGMQALGTHWPGEPERVVLAGHSIGAAVATLMASEVTLRPRVGLVVHLDGVESRGGYLHKALQADSSTPVLQLLAPASSLNDGNSARRVVSTFRPGGSFTTDLDGAVVVTANHCDPAGNFPLNACGSDPANQRAFFDLAVAGANQALDLPGVRFDSLLSRLAEPPSGPARVAAL